MTINLSRRQSLVLLFSSVVYSCQSSNIIIIHNFLPCGHSKHTVNTSLLVGNNHQGAPWLADRPIPARSQEGRTGRDENSQCQDSLGCFFGCCYVFSVWPCVLKQRWWLFLGRKSRPCSSFPTVHPGTKAYTSGLQWEVMWECPAIGGVSLVQSLATPDWLCMCPQPGHKPCHNGCLCPQVLPACPLSSSVFLCAKTYRLACV